MNIICVKNTKLYRRQINIPIIHYRKKQKCRNIPFYLIGLYSNQYPSSHKIIKQRASEKEYKV